MHNVDKELGGVFGEVIDQFGPILVCGDVFNQRNYFVWNQASVGQYINITMGWQI